MKGRGKYKKVNADVKPGYVNEPVNHEPVPQSEKQIENNEQFNYEEPNYDSNQGNYSDQTQNTRNCFKCQQPGHISRDCPQQGNSTNRNCYKCNQPGHMSRECPERDNNNYGKDTRTCYKCNQPGHMSRECPERENNNYGKDSRTCYKCNQPGHMVKECPGQENSFNNKNDNRTDNFDKSYDNQRSGGNRNCFKCNKPGHSARDCTENGIFERSGGYHHQNNDADQSHGYGNNSSGGYNRSGKVQSYDQEHSSPDGYHRNDNYRQSYGDDRGGYRGGNNGGNDRGGYRGDNIGNDRGGYRGGNNGNDRGGYRGGYNGNDRGGYRNDDRDGYHGGDRGGYHGGDRGGYHGGDRGGYHGGDRGGYHGGDRGGYHGGDRGGYHGNDRGFQTSYGRGGTAGFNASRGGGYRRNDDYNHEGMESHYSKGQFGELDDYNPMSRSDFGGRTCYKCNQPGHMAKDCQTNVENGGDPMSKRSTFRPPSMDKDLTRQNMNTGINFEKYDTIKVKILGKNPPSRALEFNFMNLHPIISNTLKCLNFQKPTPIQSAVIPTVLSERDLVGIAQTGSGKTAAFLIPILSLLLKSKNFKNADSPGGGGNNNGIAEPRALILVPTRELARQIYEHCEIIANGTNIVPCYQYGGLEVNFSRQLLMKGCDILSATPGRLQDFLSKGLISLEKCEFLVLDEADRMLQQGGFYDAVKTIVSHFGDKKPRVLMFSATFPNEVSDLANEYLVKDFIRIEVGKIGGANEDVVQELLLVPTDAKDDKLEEILNTLLDKKVIIFVERKQKTDYLGLYYASIYQSQTHVSTLHADRTQQQRHETIADFSNRRIAFLFATSVAARGLDIPFVDYVINYDLPNNFDDYVHRIGRTARAGRSGKAISFFDPKSDESQADRLIKVMSSSQQIIPDWMMQYDATGALGGGGGAALSGGFNQMNLTGF